MACNVVLLLNIPLLIAITVLNMDCQLAEADDFFFRSPKWSHLGPSGGSLVSGRGNFRPGFNSRIADSRLYMAEPLFAYKRSRTNVGGGSSSDTVTSYR